MGLNEFPMITMAILMGGHVRVGFEDNLYLSKGVRAKSNAELVEKVGPDRAGTGPGDRVPGRRTTASQPATGR